MHERGADRGGGCAHGDKALAHRVHAADRGERGLGGAGAPQRVGGLERGGHELVERDALRRAQTHVALDLAHRPAAQHPRKLFAHGAAPAGRGGLASGLAWGGLARGRFARRGVGAPPMASRRILLARVGADVAPPRGLARSGRGRRRHHVAVEARLLLVVERAVEGRERGLDRVEGRERGVDPLLHRLEPRRRRRGHVLRAVGGEPLGRLVGVVAQAFERGALLLVGADDLRDGVERPVLELGALLAAAADELLDHGTERPAAGAAQRGISALGVAPPRPILAIAIAVAAPILIAGAPPLVIAGAPAVIGVAGTIFAAISDEILPGILGLAAAPPVVEAADAPAIAARAIVPAILHAVLFLILAL